MSIHARSLIGLLLLVTAGCAQTAPQGGAAPAPTAQPAAAAATAPADDSERMADAGDDTVSDTGDDTLADADGEAVDDDIDYSDGPSLAPQPCLAVRQVRRMVAVGDHSILFYVGQGDVWRNRLRRRCPSMRPGNTFSYEVRINRLCSGDLISVVDDFGGRFETRGRCVLGEFEYLTEDQAEAFKAIR